MTTTTAAPVARRPRVILAVLTVDAVAYSLLQASVTPAVPEIQHSLGATPSAAAWVLTAFLLTAAIATPIAGRLGDMYGKRRVLTGVLALLAAGIVLAAVSRSLGLLIAARALQGVAGGVFPLAFGIVRDELPAARVPSGIGWVSAMLGVGTSAGNVVSGPVVEHLGYRALFWCALGPVLLALIASAILVPESPVRSRVGVAWSSAALLCVGLTGLLLAITQGPQWGWGSARTLGLFAAGAALLAAWTAADLRSRTPLVDMRMMRLPVVWTTNVAGLLLAVGMFGAFIVIPQLAVIPAATGFGLGTGPTGAALLLLPTAVMMLATGVALGRLEARFGLERLLIAGAAISALAYALLAVAHHQVWEVALIAAVAGVGIGLSLSVMPILIVATVAPDQTGVATGMNTLTRWVGGAFGSQVSATVIAASVTADGIPADAGFTQAFAIIAGLLVVATVVSFLVPRTRALA
ncbi:MFS transporter [Baekduia soli]|uniref:MFS transporter n=1 Tax=Baekduia soli TaxID=496014 RepID=UPI001651DEE2|nr:MFS transporter [Baekduia soli]